MPLMGIERGNTRLGSMTSGGFALSGQMAAAMMLRLSIITKERMRIMSLLKIAVHPGRILLDEYMEPLGLSAIKLAGFLDVPRTRIERLIKEETAMSVDTALRLAQFFETTPNYWMNLQTNFDLATADDGAFDIPKMEQVLHPAI